VNDLQALRYFCLDRVMERLERMPEFISLVAARQPCTRVSLRDWFDEPGAPFDDVKNRIRLLYSLGALQVKKDGCYCLSPLGMCFLELLEKAGCLPGCITDESWKRLETGGELEGEVEFDAIDLGLA